MCSNAARPGIDHQPRGDGGRLSGVRLPHRARPGLLATLAVLWLLPCAISAAEIHGVVRLKEQGRQLRSAADVAVYFRPDQPAPVVVPEQPLEMATRNKEFAPRVLAVPVGGAVRFPNLDPILHNVFSSSSGNRFDVGLYGPGSGETQRFDEVGLVRVYCNVHQAMVGHILVLDTPHYTMADTDGRFRLEGVAEGPGTLYVWHERSRAVARRIEVPAADALEIELALTQRKVPNHSNKFGRSYRRSRDRDRY